MTPLRTLATIASLEEENRWLGELLAIIHRDGGHHQSAVGTENAVKDAHKTWVELQSNLERLEGEKAKLREGLSAAVGYMTNAAIDLDTGAPKKTALATINGGIARARRTLEETAPETKG